MKAKDVKPGDTIIGYPGLRIARVGQVVRVEKNGNKSSIRKIYFNTSKFPVTVHYMTEVAVIRKNKQGREILCKSRKKG